MTGTSDPGRGLTIRLATDADYDEVMKIVPNLYDGRDYLPKYYHAMISHPNRIPFIYSIDNQMIGFGMFLVINNGTAVLREGGRVIKQFRGKGITYTGLKLSLEYVWRLYPHAATMHTVFTGDQVFHSMVTKDRTIQRHSHRVLSRVKMENFGSISTSISTSSDCYKSLAGQVTGTLTSTEAIDTLSDLKDVDRLRGDYVWMVNSEVFSHFNSNYTLLTQSNVIPAVVVITHAPNDSSIHALSFGTKTELREGMLFRIDLYIAQNHRGLGSGEDLMRRHTLKHLGLFAQLKYQGEAFVDVLYPKEVDSCGMGRWLASVLPGSNQLLQEDTKVYFVEVDTTHFRNRTSAKL